MNEYWPEFDERVIAAVRGLLADCHSFSDFLRRVPEVPGVRDDDDLGLGSILARAIGLSVPGVHDVISWRRGFLSDEELEQALYEATAYRPGGGLPG